MNDIWLYLLKASLSLSLLYLVYWFFLRKETLFITSRYYLLASLAISVILPLISINYTVQLTGETGLSDSAASFLNLSGSRGSDDAVPTGLKIMGIIYLAGLVVFLLRIVLQFIILAGLIIKNGIEMSGGTKIVYNSRYLMPFSFMNLIFINPDNIRESELSDIIAHEKVHIQEYHWFDLLIVELLSIILWFNPFIWFFERSIKQNHEYLADEGVIAQGYNVGRYHSVLINQLLGMEVIGITNNLNYSLNAKRLKMMKRTKTPRTRALYTIWALPVIILLLAAFATPRYVNDSSADVSKATLITDAGSKLSAMVYDKNGDPVTGATVKVKGTNNGTVTDASGSFTIDVNDNDIVIITFKGYEDAVIDMKTVTAKQGKSDNYKIKIVMSPPGKSMEKSTGDLSKDEMILKLEQTMKKLTQKKEELGEIKQKIGQMEKEGTVSQEELDKKKAALKAEMTEINEKMKEVSQKLESLKK